MSTPTFSTGIDPSVVAAAGGHGNGYRAQAAIMADSEIDLVLLEMMRDVSETRACLEAAAGTGLPVWLGLNAERAADEFAAAAIGGCFGIRPAHVAEMRRNLDARSS